MNIEKEIAQRIDKALDGDCGHGVGEYLTAAIMPLVKRAQAEALREASRKCIVECRNPADVRDMMRAEAVRIEQEAEHD